MNIVYTDANETHVTIIHADGTHETAPSPPEDGPTRSLYDAWLEDGNVVGKFTPAPSPSPRLPKLLVVERLIAAGKFDAAMSALGGIGSAQYERWSASNMVDPDNAEVIGLMTAIGADLDVILAVAV